jgi:surface antigen
MLKKTLALLVSGALVAGLAVGPVAAQPRSTESYNNGYDDGYDAGYSAGYDRGYSDGRAGRPRDRAAPPRVTPPVAAPSSRDLPPRDRWKDRYSRNYSYDDDAYYRECRNQPDPAGVIAGALLGGLLGNAVGNQGSKGVATVAGVVLGGTVGAALTNGLNCEDRSYAYKTYTDAFNNGRPNRSYDWTNPRSGNRGSFRVRKYYDDEAGFRCATYSQTIYVRGRPQEAEGYACQQPDNTWVIMD